MGLRLQKPGGSKMFHITLTKEELETIVDLFCAEIEATNPYLSSKTDEVDALYLKLELELSKKR